MIRAIPTTSNDRIYCKILAHNGGGAVFGGNAGFGGESTGRRVGCAANPGVGAHAESCADLRGSGESLQPTAHVICVPPSQTPACTGEPAPWARCSVRTPLVCPGLRVHTVVVHLSPSFRFSLPPTLQLCMRRLRATPASPWASSTLTMSTCQSQLSSLHPARRVYNLISPPWFLATFVPRCEVAGAQCGLPAFLL